MATRLHDVINKSQQTTNATPATVTLYTVPTNSIASAYVHIVARTSGGVRASYLVYAAAGREGAGASLVSTAVSVITAREDAGAAAWDAVAALSSNDLAVTVTGAAATTIDWMIHAEIYSWTP